MVWNILLSYTVFFGFAFLLGVGVASYLGTTVALRRYFGDEFRNERDEGRR